MEEAGKYKGKKTSIEAGIVPLFHAARQEAQQWTNHFTHSGVAISSQITPQLVLLDLHNLQVQQPEAPQKQAPLLMQGLIGPTL